MPKYYSTGEFAAEIGKAISTVQRWDRAGILKAHRTATNRRYYTEDQVQQANGLEPAPSDEVSKKTVLYARVSSRNQKDDLVNQVEFLRQFANARGMIVDETVEEIGSGLNYNRKKWNILINQCFDGQVGTILVTHKDRFIRFGFDWFERTLKRFGAKITVVNNESTSPQEEMVQDIISILHVFSCRIYGLRKYKDKIRKDPQCNEGKEGVPDGKDKHS